MGYGASKMIIFGKNFLSKIYSDRASIIIFRGQRSPLSLSSILARFAKAPCEKIPCPYFLEFMKDKWEHTKLISEKVSTIGQLFVKFWHINWIGILFLVSHDSNLSLPWPESVEKACCKSFWHQSVSELSTQSACEDWSKDVPAQLALTVNLAVNVLGSRWFYYNWTSATFHT